QSGVVFVNGERAAAAVVVRGAASRARRLPAGATARVVGIAGARGPGLRHVEASPKVRSVVELPAVADGAVVFVRQHDDGQQRVGSQELGTLGQHRLIGAVQNRRAVLDRDGLVGVR